MCVSTSNPILVADIGGTNARFALTTQSHVFLEVRVLSCKEYPGIADAIRHYLSLVGDPSVEVAIIAIATPVQADEVRMTNHHWSFSVDGTRRQLGFRKLLVINDFFALAMSLPYLDECQRQRLDQRGRIRLGMKAVIGPGTGLGVAGLMPFESGWLPLASEGGHTSFAPADAMEVEILRRLWHDHPHVSAERLLSGPGIFLLYQTLCAMSGTRPAANESAEVVALAGDGCCEVAKQTLSLFSALLGGVAGNVALTYGCTGGLYLGGGILGKLGTLFDTERFNQRFAAKGRFSAYLEDVPRWLITAENPAFIGAESYIRQYLHQAAES